MPELSAILFDLFLIFAAAKVAGELFERLRQPPVIGELLAGVLIGPYVLGWIGQPNADLLAFFGGDPEAAHRALDLVYDVLAELGVIVLLFLVGLETRLEDLLRVGLRSSVVAALGVALPFALGFAFMALRGEPTLEALFLGAALTATSVGITARVLRDMGVLGAPEARIILAAAVLDDILALLVLAVVSGIASGEGLSPGEITGLAVVAVGFVALVALVGSHLTRRYSLHLTRLRLQRAPLAVALVVMLGLAAVAGSLGLAAIIGAFLAGMVLAESREHFALEHQTMPVYELLVPFFFVIVGSRVDVTLFAEGGLVAVALAVLGLAIVGKLLGCGLGGLGLGRRSMAILGVGMVPRGEVGLIVAAIGLSRGAISQDLFAVVVFMSIVTTLLAPPLLVWLYRGRREPLPPGEEPPVGPLPEL